LRKFTRRQIFTVFLAKYICVEVIETDIETILKRAARDGASDVYLFPGRGDYVVRVRTPGAISSATRVQPADAQKWINYLKYQAGMNLSEHRRVQQGALWYASIDRFLRLSAAGDYQDRESLVIRLIAPIPAVTPGVQPIIDDLARQISGRGLLTVCGPTGSGKTTLLYQLAGQLADDRVVMTIEDPVEVSEPRFLQLQVNQASGQTYASLLKAALRHRPDIVIIGELRDAETAQAACEAALAGHIVLATVHTRSPADVPLRLISMGVQKALVDSALRVSAQCQLLATTPVQPVVEVWSWQDGVGRRNGLTIAAQVARHNNAQAAIPKPGPLKALHPAPEQAEPVLDADVPVGDDWNGDGVVENLEAGGEH
jgi:competence protein ComGA